MWQARSFQNFKIHFKIACLQNSMQLATGNITSNSLLQKIRNELLSGHLCSQVIKFCPNAWPSQARVVHDLQPYFQVRNDILFQRSLL